MTSSPCRWHHHHADDIMRMTSPHMQMTSSPCTWHHHHADDTITHADDMQMTWSHMQTTSSHIQISHMQMTSPCRWHHYHADDIITMQMTPCRWHHTCRWHHHHADDIITHADDTTLMAESAEVLKTLLMRVKEESKEAGLKLSIQKAEIMASSPITSWQIDGGKWKQWQISFSWWAAVHGISKSWTRLSNSAATTTMI